MSWRFVTATLLAFVVVSLAWSWWSGAATASPPAAVVSPSREDRVVKSDEEWKKQLTASEFKILRQKGTEWAFTGEFHDHKDDGVYTCAGCGLELYDSRAKFDSGTGWPSYTEAVASDRVDRLTDDSHGMRRVELTCARCGGHLGHVFPDGPAPTGERHCINSASLDFVPRSPKGATEKKRE